jgi:uncharacterized protein YodC (DUF2158 family)
MTEQIKVGDIVQLKSGSPKMTVSSLSETKAWCTWYDFATNRLHEEVIFPLQVLTTDYVS